MNKTLLGNEYKKGQSSLEQLIIFSIGLSLVAIIFYFAVTYTSDNLRVSQARDMVNKIAKASDYVNSLGPGTKDVVHVYVPEGISAAEIENNSLRIRVSLSSGDSDIFADTQANLIGKLITNSGPQDIELRVLNNNKVFIGKSYLICLKSSIVKNIIQGNSEQDDVGITNLATFGLTNISAGLSGNLDDLISINQPSNTLDAGSSDTVGLNFTVPIDKTVGTYSGYLLVSGSNNSQCAVSITVFVNSIGSGEDASGPIVTNISTIPKDPTTSDLITVVGNATDATTGGSDLSYCELDLDYSGIWNMVDASDGAYDEVSESLTYDLGALSAGQHTVRTRCEDVEGNLGSPYAYTFMVNSTSGNGTEDGAGPIVIDMFHTPYPTTFTNITVSGIGTDLYTGNSTMKGCNLSIDSGNWIPITPEDGVWDSVSEPFNYSVGKMSVGMHNISYVCEDILGNVGLVQTDSFLVVDVDLMLVLDRSGSMADYINGASDNTEVSTSNTYWTKVKTIHIDSMNGTGAQTKVELKGGSWWYSKYVYYKATINGNTISQGSTSSSSYDTLTDDINLSGYTAPFDVDLWLKTDSSSYPAYNRDFSILLPPTKMSAVQSASKSFVDMSSESVQEGLVSYSSSATLDKMLAGMTESNKQSLENAIDALNPDGATCIECGLDTAADELTSSRAREDATKVIILLTDGRSNSGDSVDGAVYCRDRNITVYTIGFGSDVDSTELTNIALLTYGQYYYAPDEETLNEIFNSLGRVITSVHD